MQMEYGLSQSSIIFSNVRKYDGTVKGMDEFNAIECASNYVNCICKNSVRPEFFITKNESLFEAGAER